MPDVTAFRLGPVEVLFLLAFVVLSSVVYGRWARRRRRIRPADLWANPVAWRRYWLTNFFMQWAYMVATALALFVLLEFTLPMPRSVVFSSLFWDIGTGLVVGMTVGMAIGVLWRMTSEWKKARRQAGAHSDHATPPP